MTKLVDVDDNLDTFPEGFFTEEQPAALHAATMRSYFERGCLCIFSGRLKALEAMTPDSEAVAFYEANCKCTRNYENRDLQDDESSAVDSKFNTSSGEVPF
jgi:hypothetical protein